MTSTVGADRAPAVKRLSRAALLGGFVAGWDASAMFFIFPDIRDGIGGGDETVASWVLSITSVVGAALLLQAGRLADRFGHQRLFRVGAGAFAAAAMLAAVAPFIAWLVIARGVMAVGLSLMGPAAVAIILAAAREAERSTAIARWGVATAVSGVIGPLATTQLIELFGWRSSFVIMVPVGLMVLAMSWTDAGLDKPQIEATFSLLESAVAMAGFALLILPIVEGNDWGWGSVRVVGCFLSAAALLGWLIWRSTRVVPAPFPLDLFHRPSFALSCVASVTGGVHFFAQWLALLLFLTEVWDYTLVEAGLVLTIMPLVMSLTAVKAGRLADQHGHRTVMLPALATYVASYGVFWAAADEQRNLGLLLPALIASGLAMAAVWPSLTSAGTQGVEGSRMGSASAMIQTLQRIGGAVGIALVVSVIAGNSDLAPASQHLRAVAVMPLAASASFLVLAFVRPVIAPPSQRATTTTQTKT